MSDSNHCQEMPSSYLITQDLGDLSNAPPSFSSVNDDASNLIDVCQTHKEDSNNAPINATVALFEKHAHTLMSGYDTLDSPLNICVDIHTVQFPCQEYNSKYFCTESGNKISLNAILNETRNILIQGCSLISTNVVLRGDAGTLHLGKYVIIGESSCLLPSRSEITTSIPMKIGDYTIIGKNCVIKATTIENGVIISNNSVIVKLHFFPINSYFVFNQGERCILKSHSVILPNSVVPSDTTIPALTMFGGVPARFIGDISESATITHKRKAISLYNTISISV
ncbi:dynactin subunit 5-like isoform X2 [Hylaeus volcanicus]|uniref:dynactin subunit 5-like isoform X2 n=1 Tax=Hylaeus volcanicus TaxID=313075 RepID=UPI0023B83D82|nr:dynactin subunit 5-like isoform X2 [Hylaeus volcanicus]